MNIAASVTRRDLLRGAGATAVGTALAGLAPSAQAGEPRSAASPNFIVVYTDDLGYGDLGCYGSPLIETPVLDGMARRGMLFTDFYAAPVCTPSRAELLTGCYAPRVNLPAVLFPNSTNGLAAQETTVAEYLKSAGYATAWIGKWHLGVRPQDHPLEHGFDRFFGLPYSNDMTPTTWPPLPLYDDRTVIEVQPDQAALTRRYSEQTTAFVRAHADQPFFLVLSHTQPHEPLFSEFAGRSAAGPHGDSVQEIDHYLGLLLHELDALGIRDHTCVMFTSDNGPWYVGSAGHLRGRKMQTYEGGVRVPLVVEWPAVVPPGVTYREPARLADLLPTLCAAAGVMPRADRVIDGRDLMPALSTGRPVDRGDLFYYNGTTCRGVRHGDWKLHDRQLYNLRDDPEESYDLALHHPDIASDLTARLTGFHTALLNDHAAHYG
ncbi:arylsulfatase [Jiangella ureilytica]|uniref:Arylsulfatase n=1 Tax=Jiangella ureilytica TaxID=2530374 RepID=A0A4R4RL77_9ACTN|nr:sulfatase [Jiangella ureilytica]TDC50357.1 arylsulfatase [Jiangella ureilytica]